MKFNNLYRDLLEDFNVSPQSQNAINNGQDIGMTSGDPNNTFPSRVNQLQLKLPHGKKNKAFKKRLPREMSTKYHQDIRQQKNQA